VVSISSDNPIYNESEKAFLVEFSEFSELQWSLPVVDLGDIELTQYRLLNTAPLNDESYYIDDVALPPLNLLIVGGSFQDKANSTVVLADGTETSWNNYFSRIYARADVSESLEMWSNPAAKLLAGDTSDLNELMELLHTYFGNGFKTAEVYSAERGNLPDPYSFDNELGALMRGLLFVLWALPTEQQGEIYYEAKNFFKEFFSSMVLRLDEPDMFSVPVGNHWLNRGVAWMGAGSFFAEPEWLKTGVEFFTYGIDVTRPDGSMVSDSLRGGGVFGTGGRGIDALVLMAEIGEANGIDLWAYESPAGTSLQDLIVWFNKSYLIEELAMEYAQNFTGSKPFSPNGDFSVMWAQLAVQIFANKFPDDPYVDLAYLSGLNSASRFGERGWYRPDDWYLDDAAAVSYINSRLSGPIPGHLLYKPHIVERANVSIPTDADDIVLLGVEANVIELTGGLDVLDGGDGLDTLLIDSEITQFELYISSPKYYEVTNSNGEVFSFTRDAPLDYLLDPTGEFGINLLSRIERLQFTDTAIARDIDGNAGTVAKILGAVFGADQVSNKAYAGIGLSYLDSGDWNFETLGALAMGVHAPASNTEICEILWEKVVGPLQDASDISPFVAMLDEEQLSVGELVKLAANTALNLENINFSGLQSTGLEYTPFV